MALAGAIALQAFVDEMGLVHTVKNLGCGNHEVHEFYDRIKK